MMKEKLETLCRLNGIECRIGGSTLLKHHGLIDVANDFDIFVEPDQFERLDNVLSRVGEKRDSKPHADYLTTYFGEYEVEGVEIDVMASFRMKCTDGIYTHPYVEPVNGWMHLEEWAVLYTVMERPDKVDRIKAYFHDYAFDKAIVRTCLLRAPDSIVEQVMTRFQDEMKR